MKSGFRNYNEKLIDMDKVTFQNTQKLYHYTSVCSAMKIIASKTLIFGKPQRMNDIHEVYRGIFYENAQSHETIEAELGQYRQLSLVNDNTPRAGYDIPAMWGHYAEKGNGVCLVFDKQKLLSCLKADMWHESIRYDQNYDSSIKVPKENIEGYFKTHKDEIFFTKTGDWAYEQEFRVVTRLEKDTKDPLKLDFKDSLVAVIFYFAPDVPHDRCVSDSVNVKAIEKIAPDLPILEFGYWDGKANLRDQSGSEWSIGGVDGNTVKLDAD